MIKRTILSATALLACLSFNSVASEPLAIGSEKKLPADFDKLTVEKLTSLNQLHDVVVSSDGKFLVYGKKEGFVSDNNHLYLQNLTTGEVKQLTNHAQSESNVVFSNDNQSIFFLSSRSGSAQIWQLPLFGGEAEQITDLKANINGFKLNTDNNQFLFSITAKPGCKTIECTAKAKKSDAEKKHNVRAYDQLMVRHWDVWADEYNEHLFYAKKPTNSKITDAVDLMPDWKADIAGMSQVSFNPDGSSVVFSAKKEAKDQAWTTNFDIFEINLKDHSINNLTKSNKAWDAKPVFSNNGRFLAYAAMKKPGYESDKFTIKLRDNKTGKTRTIAPNWDRSVSSLIFGDDNRTLYATAQDVGQKSIFEINPDFGVVRTVHNDGTAGSIQVAGNKIFFTKHDLDSPADIFSIDRDGSKLTQLTHINKEKLAGIKMAEFSQFNFSGWNKEKVHGYWLKPADYQEGKKYPVAFLVHGGPQGSFGNMFHFRWNAQLWAAQGYGVVMIDFHGSTGYGQNFTDSIARDWGGKPLEDLQTGFSYIVKNQPWLDARKACALGASYGGYMMNWIAGNWNTGFDCLVNHAGLYDMPSFYGSTEELWFPEHDLGGEVWKKDSDYHKFNPAAFVENWQTPMLVIQGELDYRVPYAQSLGAFTTLQRKGIDSRLVMFPDEDHHIRKPDNLIHWYKEVFNWMNKYLD